jgi:hypothetical protein
MHRLTVRVMVGLAVPALLAAGCGGKNKQPENPTAKGDAGEASSGDTTGATTEKGDGGAGPEKKDECVGFEIGNVEDVLVKSSCEEPNVNPDAMQNVDLKGKLEVAVSASPTKVAPGGKTELFVAFTNKSKEPLTLHFKINPVPRFSVEAYDAKGKRVDMPPGNPPPPPKGAPSPPPSEVKSAKVTIAPNGSARVHLPWEAVKTKWAPEKFLGTPPERGYPRAAAGPLPKGKYTLKVVTPLVGVAEGVDKEVSAPKLEIEVGG